MIIFGDRDDPCLQPSFEIGIWRTRSSGLIARSVMFADNISVWRIDEACVPFYRITPQPLLIEAANPMEAAMLAFRSIEDRTPHSYEVVGPDTEVAHVALDVEAQEEAISIQFGHRAKAR